MKKTLAIIISLIVIIGSLGFLYYRQQSKTRPLVENANVTTGGEKLGILPSYLFSKNGSQIDFQPSDFPLGTGENSIAIDFTYDDKPVNVEFPVASGSAVLRESELIGGEIFFNVASMTSSNASPEILEDLKSSLVFDAANFPHIKFSSTGLQFVGEQVKLNGILTIRGTAQTVSIPIEPTSYGYSGSYDVVLSSFGITESSVSENIHITFQVQTK